MDLRGSRNERQYEANICFAVEKLLAAFDGREPADALSVIDWLRESINEYIAHCDPLQAGRINASQIAIPRDFLNLKTKNLNPTKEKLILDSKIIERLFVFKPDDNYALDDGRLSQRAKMLLSYEILSLIVEGMRKYNVKIMKQDDIDTIFELIRLVVHK